MAPNKILICKLRFYGDMLLTTPLINLLAERYPKAKIDILLYDETKQILLHNPQINQFYCIKRKPKNILSKIVNFLNIRHQLNKQHYDLILNLAEQWSIALLIKSIRHGESVAFLKNSPKDKHWKRYFSHCIPVTGEHIIEQNISILSDLIDPRIVSKKMFLYYVEQDKQTLLNKYNTLFNQPYIIVHATSRQYYKLWDNAKFVEVIDYYRQQGLVVFLTSGPAQFETDRVKTIYDSCLHKPNMTFAGNTTFSELAVLIDHAELFIGLDSAPMHMAAALYTPIVCLFGASDYKKWGPQTRNSITLLASDYEPMPTRAQLDRKRKYLSTISAKMVITAGNQLLASQLKKPA